MATGIQTSVRRGRTRGSLDSNKKRKPLESLAAGFQEISPKMKIGLAGVLVVMSLAGILGTHSVSQNRHVDLYPVGMDSENVRDVSMTLTELGIEHKVALTKDGVTLHPNDRLIAQAKLAQRALPRGDGMESKKKKTGSFPDPADVRARLAIKDIQSELVHTLRAMDDINDARVQIVLPKQTYFQDDHLKARASVFLKIRDGVRLDPRTVGGITALISHSVPKLDKERIAVLGPNGFELTVKQEDRVLESRIRVSEEHRMERKLQKALGRIYGDNVHAVVNLELDFSETEERRWTPGSSSDDGMVKDSVQLVHEMLEGATAETGKSYDQKKEAINYKYTESYFARLKQRATIERITATVLVDGASPQELKEVSGIVRGALGINSGRNDSVELCGLPWNRNPAKVWKESVTSNPGSSALSDTTGTQLPWLAGGLLFLVTSLVAGAALTRRTKPVLTVDTGSVGSQRAAGIVDSQQTKSGQTVVQTNNTATQGSRLDALERLMGEEPNKVAALLRSTWLN